MFECGVDDCDFTRALFRECNLQFAKVETYQSARFSVQQVFRRKSHSQS
ncbi:hypothetical protein ACX3X6_05135 [Pseudomonas sichuanensis]